MMGIQFKKFKGRKINSLYMENKPSTPGENGMNNIQTMEGGIRTQLSCIWSQERIL